MDKYWDMELLSFGEYILLYDSRNHVTGTVVNMSFLVVSGVPLGCITVLMCVIISQ